MELVKGDSENLMGNAVVYWDVEGKNAFAPDSKIIGTNFVISALPLEDKLFTATFPPITFKNYEEFISRLINVNCDIIYAGKVRFPPKEKDFKNFIKKETLKFNKIIEEYTEKYKVKFDFNPSKLSEKEKIYLLENLSKKIRNAVKDGKYINGNTDSKPSKLLKLIRNIKKDYTKYDVDNFINILYLPGDEIDNLTELYTKKFLAIYYEDYENAKSIAEEISIIESKISS
jgi:ribosomal protein S17E